jgi:membrane associated rhomboid family serine protease
MKLNVTLWLIIINVIVYVFELIFGNAFLTLFSLIPNLALKGFYWQFLTYMFLHSPGDPLHIFLNMFALLMFGPRVELTMGPKKFLIFYLICGIGSALLFIPLSGNLNTPLLGASGAIFGVLTAFGLMFPTATVFVMGFFPMPAIFAVVVFGILEIFYGVTGLEPGIANFGHLGGMITAIILLKFFGFKKQRIRYFWE